MDVQKVKDAMDTLGVDFDQYPILLTKMAETYLKN